MDISQKQSPSNKKSQIQNFSEYFTTFKDFVCEIRFLDKKSIGLNENMKMLLFFLFVLYLFLKIFNRENTLLYCKIKEKYLILIIIKKIIKKTFNYS